MLLNALAWNLIGVIGLVTGGTIFHNETAQDTGDASSKEICMKELGCFAITSDFKSLRYRPINVLPHDRVTINTKLKLFTKKNAKESQQLIASSKKSFDQSHFDAKNPVIFIVHGFMDSELYGPWMGKLKDEFLLHGDYNLIVVDWSAGNKPPYYQATANTRVVGAEIALLVQALEKHFKIKRENCHIIGHSLGSHVAGYAGERLKTLGRITACDPAGPYFENMPPSVRIDPTDALYVDVIHSDAVDSKFIGLGMTAKVGHVDFYPNSGRSQPGCKSAKITSFITDGITEGLRRFASCNHQRSLDFLHYSINYKKATPVAYECSSWQDFLDGKCADCGSDTKKCAIMGIRADEYKKFKSNSVQRAMYIKTSGTAPFWLHHYQVTIKLFKPKTSYSDVKGTIDLTLFGTEADELAHIASQSSDFVHGSQYKYLVTTQKDLGDIKSLSLKWYSTSWNPIKMIKKPNLYIEYIIVQPMNKIEASPRPTTNRIYCDKPDNGITPKTTANFYRNNKCKK